MKTHIRRIDTRQHVNVDGLKKELRDAGFYVLSGDGFIDVFAIEATEYIEEKLTKITDQVIAKYGGCVVYTQWGSIMRRILCTISIAAALLLSGCNSWHKLRGGSDDPKPTNIAGVWDGIVNFDGMSQHFSFILVQNGGSIVTGSQAFAERSVLTGPVQGGVNGNDVNLTIDEGSACTNKVQVVAQVNGGSMSVHVFGDGNTVPGGSCHGAVDFFGTFGR